MRAEERGRRRPVDDALPVQVLQPAGDLGGVEDGPLLVETRLAHVIDVELQVSPVHEGQHEAQGVLRLVGVRQTHLEEEECHVLVTLRGQVGQVVRRQRFSS